MSKIAVVAKLTAQPGKRDELVEVMKGMVAEVEAEAGTEVYALHAALEDEVTVWFYELYTDADALKAHSTSDAMKAVGPKLGGLLAGRPEVTRLSPVAAKGL